MDFDVAVIGGGSAGYTAAERAGENGLKCVLFEENEIGGVCLNVGCIPSKALLYSAKRVDEIRESSKYGVTAMQEPSVDFGKMMSRKDTTVKRLVSGIRMRLESEGVTIIKHRATVTGEADGLISVSAAEEEYRAKYLILCTGSENAAPPIEGLRREDYWDSTDALRAERLPASLAVIGGGYIGMEMASLFNSLGVKIDIVEMTDNILGTADREMASMLRKEYEKRGVVFHTGAKVKKIEQGRVVMESGGSESTVEPERIIICTGRRALTATAGIETLGINTAGRGIEVNEHMQTPNPRVYACGDVTGRSMLAHVAAREACVAVEHILGAGSRMSYEAIPSVVYTNPEFSWVGKTEDELKAAGTYYRTVKYPMTYSGRFMAENEGFAGLCKLLIGGDDRLLGCHILGNPSSEIIVIAGMAIEKGFSTEEFRKIIFPHPTVGEAIHEGLYM